MRDSSFNRQRAFFFVRDAAVPWRTRVRRAAAYAGIIWIMEVLGAVLLKYCLGLVDRPILLVLAQLAVLPILLFGCFLYAYWKAGLTERPYDQKGQEAERQVNLQNALKKPGQ